MHTVKQPEIPTLHPNAQLVEHSASIPLNSEGSFDRIEGPRHRESVKLLASTVINDINSQHEISVLDNENSRLQESLYIDALTGIPNNEAFNVALTDSIERADRGEVPHPAVFFLDLDNFKKANDELGHEYVDQMLFEIASEFAKEMTLRKLNSSTGEVLHEMFARKSGDEFVAFIYPIITENGQRDVELSPDEIIKLFTERMEKQVQEIASRHNAPFVGVSIGHVIHKDGESLERVRQRADVEMYRVKKLKKGGRIKQALHRLFNKSSR